MGLKLAPLRRTFQLQQVIQTRCVATAREVAVTGEDTPARDVEVQFGQHNGQVLGSLPHGYLKVLARMAGSRWAALAEEVLSERGSGTDSKKSFASVMEREAYVRMLRNAADVEAAKRVHSRVTQSEHAHDVFLLNTLVETYATLGWLQGAEDVFNGMRYRDGVTWEIMITAYAQNGRVADARNMFDSAPARDIMAWTTLLKCYVSFGTSRDAELVFEKMPVRDLVSATTLMNSYVGSGKLTEAKNVFDSMEVRDVVVYSSMLRAFARDGSLESTKETFEKMPEWDLATVNMMIQAYAEEGYLGEAKLIFDSFPERDDTSLEIMIKALALSGHADDAKALFDQVLKKDEKLWSLLVRAYASEGRSEDAKLIFDQTPVKTADSWIFLAEGYAQNLQLEYMELMFDRAPEWNVNFWIAAITTYAHCGLEQMARIMFSRTGSWDARLWEVFIAGLVTLGHGWDAVHLFRSMTLEGFSPTEGTFVNLLNAHAIEGSVEQGGGCFLSMVADFNLKPWREHYTALLHVLGRSKSLDRAEELIRHMPFEPDAAAWKTLLDAFRHYRDMKRGLEAGKQLIRMEPRVTWTYELLMELFAVTGKLSKVTVIQNIMEKQGGGTEQERSASWILVQNKLHRFLAGDTGHPESYQIFAQLRKLIERIREAGYVPNTKLVLEDCPSEEEKEATLFEHSEKVAVAYGILNSRPRRSLRIINTHRVCGDCHAALKLISQETDRLIVLRDDRCFHHFQHGRCSCRDYW